MDRSCTTETRAAKALHLIMGFFCFVVMAPGIQIGPYHFCLLHVSCLCIREYSRHWSQVDFSPVIGTWLTLMLMDRAECRTAHAAVVSLALPDWLTCQGFIKELVNFKPWKCQHRENLIISQENCQALRMHRKLSVQRGLVLYNQSWTVMYKPSNYDLLVSDCLKGFFNDLYTRKMKQFASHKNLYLRCISSPFSFGHLLFSREGRGDCWSNYSSKEEWNSSSVLWFLSPLPM